jgi:hypothetical protein
LWCRAALLIPSRPKPRLARPDLNLTDRQNDREFLIFFAESGRRYDGVAPLIPSPVITALGDLKMNVANVTWEDEENNRRVEFSIAYAIENQELTIREITPKSIAFLAAAEKRPLQTIQVHTSTGRRLLARQLSNSGAWESIKQQIIGCSLTA